MTRREWLALAAGVAVTAACGRNRGGGPAGGQDRGVLTSAYGDHRLQQGDLILAGDLAQPGPVIVLVHGGFWYPGYERDLMVPLATSLEAKGYTTWNIGYRPAEGGTGWPYLLEDAAAAVDHLTVLAQDNPLDLDRVVVVGHSAGGQLALWLAARPKLAAGAPGHAPPAGGKTVRPRAIVALAPAADLATAAVAKLGGRATQKFLGGLPDEVPDRYAVASPLQLVPIGTPAVLVHGTADDLVPVSQSHAYLTAARAAGDTVELVEVEAADHFDVINPAHRAWAAVTDRLPGLLS